MLSRTAIIVFSGCTVAARNYLAHARVLAESFLAHNPGARFFALIVDGDDPSSGPSEPFEALAPADVGIDRAELHRRATMYGTQGLLASMKPQLLGALLARGGDPVLYLDADGCVYSGLEPLAGLAASHGLVLSPHTLDPYPFELRDRPEWIYDSPEQIILRAGVMNAGLIGVGPGAEPFLEWLAQRTRRRCIYDARHGLMLTQTWLTMASSLFDHHVLRDRGCNVAGWNIHTRDIEWEGERPVVDGVPLRHFHFAGSFDPEQPEMLTQVEGIAAWWTSLDRRPGVGMLAREYAQRLLAHGYRDSRAQAPAYTLTPAGEPLTPQARESYRMALLDAEAEGREEPPNPFADGDERFAGWIQQHVAEQEAAAAGHGESVALPGEHPRTLARIAELEHARDEAIGWAQRVSSELELVCSELRSERERNTASLDEIYRSASWRLTKPLRAAKAALRQRRVTQTQ